MGFFKLIRVFKDLQVEVEDLLLSAVAMHSLEYNDLILNFFS